MGCNSCGSKSATADIKYVGWTPVLTSELYDTYYVWKVINWINGSGNKPPIGLYVGPVGYVSTVEEAVKIDKSNSSYIEDTW